MLKLCLLACKIILSLIVIVMNHNDQAEVQQELLRCTCKEGASSASILGTDVHQIDTHNCYPTYLTRL